MTTNTDTAYEDKLEQLKAPFPEEILEQKDGPKKKVGNRWETQIFRYIPQAHVQERLDQVFGLDWNWEIISTQVVDVLKIKKKYENQQVVGEEEILQKQVIVHGRLSLLLVNEAGHILRRVSRDACGGCDVTYGSQPGDSFKIADSFAFRKAAQKYGVGAYLALEDQVDATSHEEAPVNTYRKNNANTSSSDKTSAPAKSNSNPFRK